MSPLVVTLLRTSSAVAVVAELLSLDDEELSSMESSSLAHAVIATMASIEINLKNLVFI